MVGPLPVMLLTDCREVFQDCEGANGRLQCLSFQIDQTYFKACGEICVEVIFSIMTS